MKQSNEMKALKIFIVFVGMIHLDLCNKRSIIIQRNVDKLEIKQKKTFKANEKNHHFDELFPYAVQSFLYLLTHQRTYK